MGRRTAAGGGAVKPKCASVPFRSLGTVELPNGLEWLPRPTLGNRPPLGNRSPLAKLALGPTCQAPPLGSPGTASEKFAPPDAQRCSSAAETQPGAAAADPPPAAAAAVSRWPTGWHFLD
eukprot:SAG31_NODE_4686_length_3032_cov_1.744630_2_plen_120_part_00